MTQITLTHRIEELNDLEAMIEELKNEAEAIKDAIKQEMTDRNLEEMIVGDYIIRWVDVLSSRFDTKRFKTELGEDLYKSYTKEVASKRFSISH
ncbi:MAG: hypothetical protein IJ136_06465 [Erysipelotrichaceae bacterium]|nr:hypothetical protein [Erysipelotrichaceae bacterium]